MTDAELIIKAIETLHRLADAELKCSKLEIRVRKLRECLEYYSNKDKWEWRDSLYPRPSAHCDRGYRAREVLAQDDEEAK
jgi:hypothetical protein